MDKSPPMIAKKSAKQQREMQVLLGLVEYYIKTGKPVGSNTLKETGFPKFSSATIRNYFSNLEKDGYLKQLHSSGGRIPTTKAYRTYATASLESEPLPPYENKDLNNLRLSESREITTYLQQASETLTKLTKCAVFLSAPRFDHDFVTTIKLVPIDQNRCLCVLITDFGMINTELLHTDLKLNAFSTARIESYFHWRLTGNDKPENLEKQEEQWAQQFYNELMVRYIVGYSNFIDEDVYRTGFTQLLKYPEFQDSTVLASCLSLFENAHSMRLILRESCKNNALKFWIGKDLKNYSALTPECTVIATPYTINNQVVGAVGLLGAIRIPYRQLFAVLKAFTDSISEALTRNIYKFKISYRQPSSDTPYLQKEEKHLLGQSRLMLLEDKS